MEYRFVKPCINGKQLHSKLIVHQKEPDVKKPVLVFLHEGLGCIEPFKDVPELICRKTGLDALIYDRQGHGQSSQMTEKRGLDYVHVEAYVYLKGILDYFGIGRPILIGHSDGGSIALLYAAKYPDSARCVITEAAHVFVEDVTLAGIRKTVKNYRSSDLNTKLSRYHGQKTDALFYAWADTWLADWFKPWNIEKDIQGIKCPLLVMQGKDDPYGTVDQVNRIVINTGPRSVACLIDNCGHTPHLEAKEKTLFEMVSEIEKVQSMSGRV